MKKLILTLSFLLFATFSATSQAAAPALKTNVVIKQNETQLQFKVQITNSENQTLHFKLSPQAKIQDLGGFTNSTSADGTFDLSLKAQQTAQVTYTIDSNASSAKSLFLTSDDSWLPTPMNSRLTSRQGQIQSRYSVSATLLPGFQLINSATGHDQEDLAFVICKCRKYTSANQKLNIYLTKDEPELARTLLEALQGYLVRFESQFGPYPYDQFSVVESPDEIGYAFPKMTWIGSQLLHFPFILKTSLPHELLHSWWGNGVFVESSKGNWCEGLTTFGADYGLLSDSDKKLYRVKAITNFLNYARTSAEISLSQFTSRGEDRQLQAIGYDKALMVFIMLETRVGKTVFNQALREFYKKYRYQKASFEDFFQVLERTANLDFTEFKKFWLYQKGLLAKDLVRVSWQDNPQQLIFDATPLALNSIAGLPINILALMPDQSVLAFNQKVRDDGKGLELKSMPVPTRPLSYTFDQDFFLLRELSANEKPVTFSQFFASPSIKVLTTDTGLVSSLTSVFANSKFEATTSLPNLNNPQLIVMDSNQAAQLSEVRTELKNKGIELGTHQFSYRGQNYELNENSFFVTMKIKQSRLVILGLGTAQTASRWLQRWSHYGDKGYLILDTKAAITQGVWLEPSPLPL